MATTARERKRKQRDGLRQQGFISKEVWVLKSNEDKLLAVEQALRGKFNDCCIEEDKITIWIDGESE